MKSERRHELEQNALAEYLGRIVARLQPYSHAILAVVLVAAVGYLAYSVWSRIAAGRAEAGWQALYTAMAPAEMGRPDAEAIARVAEDFQGTQVGQWARLVAADLHLAEGCDLLFTSRAIASQELRKAVDLYQEILAEARDPAIRQRATFGLARAVESQGDLEQARNHYTEVSRQWPAGPFAARAERRLEELERRDTREFYDRFAQFDPQPDLPGGPGGRVPFDWDFLDEAPLGTMREMPTRPDLPDDVPTGPGLVPPVTVPDDDPSAIDLPAFDLPAFDLPDTEVPEQDDLPGRDELPGEEPSEVETP